MSGLVLCATGIYRRIRGSKMFNVVSKKPDVYRNHRVCTLLRRLVSSPTFIGAKRGGCICVGMRGFTLSTTTMNYRLHHWQPWRRAEPWGSHIGAMLIVVFDAHWSVPWRFCWRTDAVFDVVYDYCRCFASTPMDMTWNAKAAFTHLCNV